MKTRSYVLMEGDHVVVLVGAENHGEGSYSDGKGNHINGLRGFWRYLKRKLASKGGIRKEKLPLLLGECI